MKTQVIHIEPHAPGKPPEGNACNGCGVCCLAEPCPLGMVLFRQRKGPCPALRWERAARMYRCGAISDPKGVAQASLPQWLRFATPLLVRVLGRLAPRWVAAGEGCDSSLVSTGSPRMGPATETGEKP